MAENRASFFCWEKMEEEATIDEVKLDNVSSDPAPVEVSTDLPGVEKTEQEVTESTLTVSELNEVAVEKFSSSSSVTASAIMAKKDAKLPCDPNKTEEEEMAAEKLVEEATTDKVNEVAVEEHSAGSSVTTSSVVVEKEAKLSLEPKDTEVEEMEVDEMEEEATVDEVKLDDVSSSPSPVEVSADLPGAEKTEQEVTESTLIASEFASDLADDKSLENREHTLLALEDNTSVNDQAASVGSWFTELAAFCVTLTLELLLPRTSIESVACSSAMI